VIQLSEQPVATLPDPELSRVWGLDALDLHDRIWASRGVRVVRPDSTLPESGPVLYLLLGETQVVSLDLSPVLKRLHWEKPKLVRVRLPSPQHGTFREAVSSDETGRFLRINRQYAARVGRVGRCWITPNQRIAALWAASDHQSDAVRAIREDVPKDRRSFATVPGSIDGEAGDAQFERWLDDQLSTWDRQSSVLDGVYPYAPGVWAHESADVGRNVRFVAPVWIGAGVRIPDDTVVVGPIVLDDETDVDPAPARIDWHLVTSAHWGIMPVLGWPRLWRISKRLFDIAFSIFALLLTLPLYPFVIAAIVIEDGWPVFFAHERQTLGGRTFPCLKFRTMCRDAEHLKAKLATANQADGPQFFIENDPRLLKVGKFLRRYQIDELPQFWNVLLGHMSVVGPRPSPDKENQYCPAWRDARLSVRPGVTGLWQIRRTRAPETDFQEWIRYDLEYVRHASWKMDIWIILKTIRKVLFG
jgi:lipopolysaccharide/colanic/teichoic acid biosynthesis glycosyltransferase